MLEAKKVIIYGLGNSAEEIVFQNLTEQAEKNVCRLIGLIEDETKRKINGGESNQTERIVADCSGKITGMTFGDISPRGRQNVVYMLGLIRDESKKQESETRNKSKDSQTTGAYP